MVIDPDDYDAQELLAESRAQRQYRNALLRHPDPRDPDFPEIDEADE